MRCLLGLWRLLGDSTWKCAYFFSYTADLGLAKTDCNRSSWLAIIPLPEREGESRRGGWIEYWNSTSQITLFNIYSIYHIPDADLLYLLRFLWFRTWLRNEIVNLIYDLFHIISVRFFPFPAFEWDRPWTWAASLLSRLWSSGYCTVKDRASWKRWLRPSKYKGKVSLCHSFQPMS